MPRFRSFARKPKLMSAFNVAGATLLLALSLAASPAPRDKLNVDLEFQVVDADSGSPISGALVALVYPYTDEPIRTSYAKAQADGIARLTHTFHIGEARSLVNGPAPLRERAEELGWNLLRCILLRPACDFSIRVPKGMHYEDTCHVCYGDRWLEVSAMGYRRLAIPLTTFTGEIGDFRAPNPPRVTVELRRGDTPADSLAEWAGEYREMNSINNSTLRILADGRFTRTTPDWEFDRPQYGYAAISGDEFKFLSEKHDTYHSGFPYETQRFAPVTWGGRRYIIDARGLRDFCAIVRQGKVCDCHFGRTGSVYLRVGDEKLKPQGAPELPRKWASYLLPEPITGTVEVVYADSTAKVRLDESEGVLAGMIFAAQGIPPQTSQLVEVVQVGLGSCIVKPYQADSDHPRSLSSGEYVISGFDDVYWLPYQLDEQ